MSAAVVGIDIGGTKILAVRLERSASGAGGAAAHAAPPRPAGASTAATVAVADTGAELRAPTPAAGDDVLGVLDELVERLAGPEPSAIGVGAPCLVGRDGTPRFSPHVPGLVGVPVAGALAERHPSAAVWVGNDATAAAWAEHTAGAGRGHDDVLMVTLGTGIGGGIVAGGRLLEGANRFAGEWGHMVVDPHGPPCPCGQRGCWERYASGSGLGRLARDEAVAGRAPHLVALAGGDPEAVRGEHVTAAAAEGEGEATAMVASLAWWLALGLANLTNVADPEVIVLGGGLVEAGEALLEPTREAFSRLVEAHDQRGVQILAAELGSRAGAVGAGLLAASLG